MNEPHPLTYALYRQAEALAVDRRGNAPRVAVGRQLRRLCGVGNLLYADDDIHAK